MEFLSKIDNQSTAEFIAELQTDCLELHALAKGELLPLLPEGNTYLAWLLEFSEEPQYKLLNLLGFYNAVNPQRQEELLLKMMSLLDECRLLVSKLKGQTPEDRIIRSSAEWMYLQGDSVNDIVKEMIDTGLLNATINKGTKEKPNFEDQLETHKSRIRRYIRTFPAFKKLEEMIKDGYFEEEAHLTEEDIAQQDKNLRSIIAKRELDS